MDSGGRSSDASRIEVGSIFRSPKELRAAASKRFVEDGRGFTAGNGGGREKKHSCSGGPPVAKRAKETKPGAPPQIRACPYISTMQYHTRSHTNVLLLYGYTYEASSHYTYEASSHHTLLLRFAEMVQITTS